MLKRVCQTAILILILSLACPGQSSGSNWENVKAIAPGTQIRLVIDKAKPLMGSLQSVTDGEVVFKHGSGPRSVARSQITSISVRKKGHRLRNALIGLGTGTALGLLVGHGFARNCPGWFCGLSADADTAVGGVGGLVGGTLVGLFWPTGRWQKVYGP
jgi:hypothetical protein